MKRPIYFLLLLVVFLISGCAGGVSDTTVLKVFDEAGNVVATLSGAAVQRDYLYTMQHQNRDKQTQKMYAKSGVVVEMETIPLSDGSLAYLPKKFTIRGEPSFQQNLETRPPDHRGWNTADKVLDFATFGLGAYFLNDFGKHSISSGQTRIGGDYNTGSFNPSTTTTTTTSGGSDPYYFPTE